jgi:DNA-binding transcriptional ArsR family regulator
MMESYEMASVFRALSCKKRFAIVKMLFAQELCVGTIAEKLGASQSSVSQHLRVLRDSGLVTDHRYGYHIHYTANTELMQKVTDNLLEMLSCTENGAKCSRKGKSCVKKDTA